MKRDPIETVLTVALLVTLAVTVYGYLGWRAQAVEYQRMLIEARLIEAPQGWGR